MHSSVALQVLGLRETPAALGARKRFFPGMRAFVLPQGAHLGKLSVTLIAFVWFFAGVSSRVRHEVAQILELFATRGARERAFPCVDARVPLVVTSTRKALIAFGA